jgi:hypothetical protein
MHVSPPLHLDGYNLGWWVVKQRTKRAKGELEPDRERRLESVRGWRWRRRHRPKPMPSWLSLLDALSQN